MLTKNNFGSRVVLLVALTVSAGLLGACNGPTVPSIIDHIAVTPSADLTSIQVALVFSNSIQTGLAGQFAIKDYGNLFMSPYSQTTPFEIGFSLNTAVFNDQQYVSVTPTNFLPNGMPIGVGTPMVQINADQPISSQFDLYGYVDVANKSWLGVAAIFNFINDQYFPNGLSVSSTFLPNAAGQPGVLATVFGPTVGSDGSMLRAGGIAIFANVRQLTGHRENLYPQGAPIISGENAGYYRAHPKKLVKLQNRLIEQFNLQ